LIVVDIAVASGGGLCAEGGGRSVPEQTFRKEDVKDFTLLYKLLYNYKAVSYRVANVADS